MNPNFKYTYINYRNKNIYIYMNTNVYILLREMYIEYDYFIQFICISNDFNLIYIFNVNNSHYSRKKKKRYVHIMISISSTFREFREL